MARLEGSETKNQNGRIEHSKVLSLSLQVDGTMVEKEEFSAYSTLAAQEDRIKVGRSIILIDPSSMSHGT